MSAQFLFKSEFSDNFILKVSIQKFCIKNNAMIMAVVIHLERYISFSQHNEDELKDIVYVNNSEQCFLSIFGNFITCDHVQQ